MILSQRAVEAAKKVLEDEFAGTSDLKDVAERMLTAALAVAAGHARQEARRRCRRDGGQGDVT